MAIFKGGINIMVIIPIWLLVVLSILALVGIGLGIYEIVQFVKVMRLWL
jgi:hypothetical protein